MIYLKTYESFTDDHQIDYDGLLDSCIEEFGDEETGQDHLDWYLDLLEDIYENGGEVYRLVWLKSPKQLKKKLGYSWCLDKDFQGVYGNIDSDHEEDMKPYVITAIIPPEFIDVGESLKNFRALPQEMEVNLIGNPTEYKIKNLGSSLKVGGHQLLDLNQKYKGFKLLHLI